MAVNGLILITPTSVNVTGAGSSATINAGGSVTFSTAATLSLNGVFSSTYDNYVIDIRHVGTNAGPAMFLRLRTAGTDSTTGYTWQVLQAGSTTVSGSRNSVEGYARITNDSSSQRSGTTVFMYGPNLPQPTAMRNVSASGVSDAFIYDYASTHSVSTAYDGFTFQPSGGSFTGLIKVYGLEQ